MRNAVMLMIMVLVYAISSDMDYADAQLLREGSRELAVNVSCAAPQENCTSNASQKLAFNSR